MRSKFLLIALGSGALAACQTPGSPDNPAKGLASVNVPVVTSTDYVFDAAAPGGTLAPGEADRLNGWFQGLGLGYGDTVYVDAGYAPAARQQVAAVAGRYGMLVSTGAPVTAGSVPANGVRVVVARRRAEVPNCPNWRNPSQPDWDNKTMSNFGCGVNSNIAAMVANPEDLLRGRDGAGVPDGVTATRAIDMYRKKAPTGSGDLKAASSKGGN
ncbi:CpaD family pilus assembly lipoprotein [Sphingomonas flavescens]|uniref:CpaD family pilus assembly lipoprotein n=1 Tax=Sphingomonas flavescens TaxID=3132797 RepID=UPI0028040649|nr:CpaD family pilus assembly lipoprotein [Sphingomonas limnosediminicola]